MIWLLLIPIWYICGYYSFKFWWSTEFKYTSDVRMLGYAVACMGVFVWFLGYIEHSRNKYTFFGRCK